MRLFLLSWGWLSVVVLGLGLLAGQAAGQAQAVCALVPVPLAERVRHATLMVEGRVSSQQVERRPDGHLVTRHALQVFKVFKGQLPTGNLQLVTPGGMLGMTAEVVSSALALRVGQQGTFLLEADPRRPGDLRAYAGQQGFIAYNLAAGTATEPFTRYPAISTSLYPALTSLVGSAFRIIQPNADLAAAEARAAWPATQRLAATPVVTGFSPAAVTAGTCTSSTAAADGILTINGSGFNQQRGTGYVEFRNADLYYGVAQPLEDDYLVWTDTQIRVRVPGVLLNTAGSGPVRVVTSDGNAAPLPANLVVSYALLSLPGRTTSYGTGIVSPAGSGGYVLHYAGNVPVAARGPFEAALATWHCLAGASRPLGMPATQGDDVRPNNENLVAFGTTQAGHLAETYNYYVGCSTGGTLHFEQTETDYLFSSDAAWSYTTALPGPDQYDFTSLALHELGHGLLLGHVVSGTGVMNGFFDPGQPRRSLDANSDLAAAALVTARSTQAPLPCFGTPYVPDYAGCPRPINLLTFTARYAPGQGTALAWATSAEQRSAYFAVESLAAGAVDWQEVTRQPAAGTSSTPRQYTAADVRPLTSARYYRLRQVGLDGSVAYSPPVLVQGAPATELVAYPNPATNRVHLSGPLELGGPARVQVLDALGRSVGLVDAPFNQAEFDLPLTNLAAGLYTLVWYGGDVPRRLQLLVE